ncbi:MAG: 30S ribosomal protein S4e [Candidatus Diapherotrites archaeon]
MAGKGGARTEKRISSGKIRSLKRKEKVFTLKPMPGPHKGKDSIPLGLILRDALGIASNAREAKRILNAGKVKVDLIERKELKFPVGLFDVISIEEAKKNYRVVLDGKGRIQLKEINPKEKNFKLCKITSKKALKKGLTQYGTNDGRSFIDKKPEYRKGDSLKIELPEQKIIERIELKKGNTAFMAGGKHVGTTGTIKEIIEGTQRREKIILIEGKEKEFRTKAENVFVVGEKKAEI